MKIGTDFVRGQMDYENGYIAVKLRYLIWYELGTKYFKSTVKSISYESVTIEWEQSKNH